MLCSTEARSRPGSCGPVHDSRRSATTLPLCARYLGVVLARLEVGGPGDDVSAARCVQWAVGLLAGGELEMLGAWLSLSDDARPGQQLFADLKDRGVEAIRFVISPDPTKARVDAVVAYPRVKVLPSFEALLRESLLQVGPTHRRAVGRALRLAVTAESLDSAAGALSAFAADSLGDRYSMLVDRWHRALADSEPFFALSPRQRRMLLLGDELVRQSHVRLRRSLSRPGILPSSERVTSLVEATLSGIGHSLPRWSAARGLAAARYSGRPVAARLAAHS
jgi:putative transposase